MHIYVIEYLPADMAWESSNCKYQIRHYEVIRETSNYIWVKKIDPKIMPERLIYRKVRKRDLFKYDSYDEAKKKIEQLLLKELKEAREMVVRIQVELTIFYNEE